MASKNGNYTNVKKYQFYEDKIQFFDFVVFGLKVLR